MHVFSSSSSSSFLFSFNFNLLILFGTSLSGGGPVVDAYSRVYRRYIFDISSLPTDANAMSHGYLAFSGLDNVNSIMHVLGVLF